MTEEGALSGRSPRGHDTGPTSSSGRRIPLRRSTVILTIVFIGLLLLYLALNPTGRTRSATRHTPTSTTTTGDGMAAPGLREVSLGPAIPALADREPATLTAFRGGRSNCLLGRSGPGREPPPDLGHLSSANPGDPTLRDLPGSRDLPGPYDLSVLRDLPGPYTFPARSGPGATTEQRVGQPRHRVQLDPIGPTATPRWQ